MTVTPPRLRSFTRSRALAALLALTVFALGLLAVAPNLHHDLHTDAGDAAHGCAITLFAGGITAAVAALILTVQPLVLARVPVLATCEAPRTSPVRLPPGRAPPALA